MTPEQQKFYDIKHTSDYKVIGLDVEYKVIVDGQKKEVVLQFEETDSNTDWVNNFLFFPWPVKLGGKIAWTTYGYARAYKSAEEKPMQEFVNALLLNPGYKAVIRGWSFGSAMAKIAARHYINILAQESKLDELTTYGDVKCWLNPFYSLRARCATIREYRNINDFVTWCVPFYWRDVSTRVGGRLRLKDLLNTPWFHANYETYDYSEYEK